MKQDLHRETKIVASSSDLSERLLSDQPLLFLELVLAVWSKMNKQYFLFVLFSQVCSQYQTQHKVIVNRKNLFEGYPEAIWGVLVSTVQTSYFIWRNRVEWIFIINSLTWASMCCNLHTYLYCAKETRIRFCIFHVIWQYKYREYIVF